MQVQQHVSKLEVLVLVHVQDTERKSFLVRVAYSWNIQSDCKFHNVRLKQLSVF